MTIENQIRDEKLQYDINRQAAKISALSSDKIDKYEYIAGEEILPSNKQQIIEQAKFTYSPWGKVFEKQTKTIEDQTKIIKDKKEQTKETEKQLDKYKDIEKDNLTTDKQREIFNELIKERTKAMTKLHSAVEFDNLLYHYKGPTKDKDFSMHNDAKSLFDMIKSEDISLTHAKENQTASESDLSDIKIGVKNSVPKKGNKKC